MKIIVITYLSALINDRPVKPLFITLDSIKKLQKYYFVNFFLCIGFLFNSHCYVLLWVCKQNLKWDPLKKILPRQHPIIISNGIFHKYHHSD